MRLPVSFSDPDRAFYSPFTDSINMPPFSSFKDARAYYSTLAHEAVHWTGGTARLDRLNMSGFGTPAYAYEELVAELGSAMLMAMMGLEPSEQDQHAQYLKSWLNLLKDKPESLQKAINDAQKAVDFLIELSPTLKRDLQAQVPDGDNFGQPEVVDEMEEIGDRVADLAMRSSNAGSLKSDYEIPPGVLTIEKPDTTPLPIGDVAMMSEQKLAQLVADDRLSGMSAEDLARKYHISPSEVLQALRQYSNWLDGKEISDGRPLEKALVMRRDGRSIQVPISDMDIAEVELALQYARRDITQAKNARELRSQRNLEDLLIAQLERLQK